MDGSLERIGVEAFDGDRLKRPGIVAVAFLADWCPFCRAFGPEFARLGRPGRSTLLVADVTSEESPLWERFRIEAVPTVFVFRDGRPIFRVDGVPGQGLVRDDLAAIEGATRAASRSSPRHDRARGRSR
jgi:thioredoxin-like negative regulator of GroEL